MTEKERLKIIFDHWEFFTHTEGINPKDAGLVAVEYFTELSSKLEAQGLIPKSAQENIEETVEKITILLPRFHSHPVLEIRLRIPNGHRIIDQEIFTEILVFFHEFILKSVK